MTETEKLTLLLQVLKDYAEMNEYVEDYTPSADSYDTGFDDGIDYGVITFARTLLERIGEKFEYPMREED